MRDRRPRLGVGGLLLWVVALLVAFAMAWLDIQRMAERGELEVPPAEAPEGASLPSTAQPVEVLGAEVRPDAAVEEGDASVR